MYGLVDPATNETLPSDAIQRVLFICHPVHVYAIPPLRSMKGYKAADWTASESPSSTSPETPGGAPAAPANTGPKEIFVARLRVLETAVPIPAQQASSRLGKLADSADSRESEKVKADIVLEDPSTGVLFAAAPYTSASVVEQTIDSSRFFALRVVGDGGRKAVLGIGFEDRSQSFDFGVTLQDVRKVLGFANRSAAEMEVGGATASSGGIGGGSGSAVNNHTTAAVSSTVQRSGTPRPIITGAAGLAARDIPGRGTSPRNASPGGISPLRQAASGRPQGFPSPSFKPSSPAPKNYSLKPGQKINVNLPGRNVAPLQMNKSSSLASSPVATPEQEQKALFSLAPPPPPAGSSRPAHAGTAPLSNNDSSFGNTESAFPLPPPPSGTVNRRRRPPVPTSPEGNEEKKPHEVAFPTPPSSTGWSTDNELHNDFDDSDFGDFQ